MPMIHACATKATALPEMDPWAGLLAPHRKNADAFVEFGVGTTQTPCTTRVIDNDANPVWDKCCEFSCGSSPCEVWFKVHDDNGWWASASMGSVTVSAEGDSSHALDKGGTLHVSIESLTNPAGPASPSRPPYLPLPPSPPPDMEQLCADECRALGFCCGDHTIGSNEFLSCSQACMIRARGTDAAACAASCDEPRGCERTVNEVTYGMCGTCSDLDLDGDSVLECQHGVQSTDACHAGCEMGEIGEASGLECPAEWTEVGNRCVRRFGVQEAERSSWEGAEAACVALGGHLASTVSERGLQQLADFCFQGGLDADCALGMRRSNPRTGTWIWTDGTPWPADLGRGGLATMFEHISDWGNDHMHLNRQYGGWGMLQGDSDGGTGPFAYVCQQPQSNLPPRTPLPPASPPAPPGCVNTCWYTSDGDCDDGGPGSTQSECAYGTLCAGSNLHPNLLGLALSTRAQTACPSPNPCPDHRHRLCGLRPPAAVAAVAAPAPQQRARRVLRNGHRLRHAAFPRWRVTRSHGLRPTVRSRRRL